MDGLHKVLHLCIFVSPNLTNLLLKFEIQGSQQLLVVFCFFMQSVVDFKTVGLKFCNFFSELLHFIILLSYAKRHIIKHFKNVFGDDCVKVFKIHSFSL
jgi:hypothetical protein